MKICGIVTEYNPFHLGHQFQIEETKKQLEIDFVIVVMSGNFVQRGEPAIFDKWTRTELALLGGADIVIELPTPYATSSAENFAKGAIDLLHQLGVVDYLCFGSESGELGPIKNLADFLINEPANFKNAIKSELKLGYSYPKARNNALKATYNGNSELLKGSNNILGVEYLKALKGLHSPILPYTIKRAGAAYLNPSIQETLPSATAIRKHLKNNYPNSFSFQESFSHAMPKELLRILDNKEDLTPVFMDHLFPVLSYLLEMSSEDSIQLIYDFPLELFNRLKTQIKDATSYGMFIEQAQSKNYTKTTIQRSLMHLFLNIKTSDLELLNLEGNGYIRLLGFKKEASVALNLIKKNSLLPLISNIKDHQKGLSDYYTYLLLNEITYSNLYNQLIFNSYSIHKKNDYRQPIIVL